MKYEYKPSGICAQKIVVEMDGDVVKSVEFTGGCDGNHKGLCSLAEGMTYEQLKQKLSGITCGFRNTSCPDQLVHALEEAISHE